MSFGEPPKEEGGEAKIGPGPQWPLAFLVISIGKAAPSEGGVVGGPSAATVLDRRLFVWQTAESGSGAFVEAPMTIEAP